MCVCVCVCVCVYKNCIGVALATETLRLHRSITMLIFYVVNSVWLVYFLHLL